MSLLGQLAQRSLGMFDGITLGTESGIAQTRRAWAARRVVLTRASRPTPHACNGG